MEKIQHWNCDVCGNAITYRDGQGEICDKMHFDIERKNKVLSVGSEGEVVVDNFNTKMGRRICKDCFDKIVSESATLKKLFKDRNGDIVY